MLDCSNCAWKHPDTCRECRIEQLEKEEKQKDKLIVIWNGGIDSVRKVVQRK